MAEAPARYGPMSLTAAAAAIATAGGAGTWVIVRSIVICAEDSLGVKVRMGIDTAASDAQGERLLCDRLITEDNPYEWWGYLPLFGHATTPDRIYALADRAAASTITIGAVTGP
jgi:hypothetical protein